MDAVNSLCWKPVMLPDQYSLEAVLIPWEVPFVVSVFFWATLVHRRENPSLGFDYIKLPRRVKNPPHQMLSAGSQPNERVLRTWKVDQLWRPKKKHRKTTGFSASQVLSGPSFQLRYGWWFKSGYISSWYGKYPYFLQGFIHPRCRISSINSMLGLQINLEWLVEEAPASLTHPVQGPRTTGDASFWTQHFALPWGKSRSPEESGKW